MESILLAWRTSRKIYLDLFNNHTAEQLNMVPAGFNNNIVWNIGHVIVAQQSLIYKGSGLPMYVPDAMFDAYKPGTKPTGFIAQDAINELKEIMTSLVEKTEADLRHNKFKIYNERTTGTGFHLTSLQDALLFNNYHEGLHLGYIMSIRKFV